MHQTDQSQQVNIQPETIRTLDLHTLKSQLRNTNMIHAHKEMQKLASD